MGVDDIIRQLIDQIAQLCSCLNTIPFICMNAAVSVTCLQIQDIFYFDAMDLSTTSRNGDRLDLLMLYNIHCFSTEENSFCSSIGLERK